MFVSAQRVPDGLGLREVSGAKPDEKAVRHARERRGRVFAGRLPGRYLASARSHVQVFARRLRGPLLWLLLLRLWLLWPLKNAGIRRRVAGYPHFSCLVWPWVMPGFGVPDGAEPNDVGPSLWMTPLDDRSGRSG